MERCEAESGRLVVFDRNEGRTRDEKIFRREDRSADGRILTVCEEEESRRIKTNSNHHHCSGILSFHPEIRT